jgi:protein-S-isoprenylcysteine O-methyltransferase Ste14
VLGVYLVLLVALVVLVPAGRHLYWFCTGVITLVAGLIAICWWKGETLKWRWGVREDEPAAHCQVISGAFDRSVSQSVHSSQRYPTPVFPTPEALSDCLAS